MWLPCVWSCSAAANEVSLQVLAWTAGSASERALPHTHAEYCMPIGFKRHTHTHTQTLCLYSVEMKWCKMTSVAPLSACDSLRLADKGSPLSLLGWANRPGLLVHTSPEVDLDPLILIVMRKVTCYPIKTQIAISLPWFCLIFLSSELGTYI